MAGGGWCLRIVFWGCLAGGGRVLHGAGGIGEFGGLGASSRGLLNCVVMAGVDLLAVLGGEGRLVAEAKMGGGVCRGGGGGASAGHCTGRTAAVYRDQTNDQLINVPSNQSSINSIMFTKVMLIILKLWLIGSN